MNGQEQKTPADGISPDGYIVDQDCFSSGLLFIGPLPYDAC